MPDTAEECVREILRRIRDGEKVIKIPRKAGGSRISIGTHYHLEPEMFLQISGYTDFTFPGTSVRLMPGELCMVPAKVGHLEKAGHCGGKLFHNLVVIQRDLRTCVHIANASNGRPHVFKGAIFDGSPLNSRRLQSHMTDICTLSEESAAFADSELARSMITTILLLLLDVMKKKAEHGEESVRISACKALVAGLISDQRLNVKKIASEIKCSADYLSHRFHAETGMRLTEYINRQRIEMSKRLLESSGLSIKEIAWACGYSDQAYLTRVFSSINGVSPRAYRKKM